MSQNGNNSFLHTGVGNLRIIHEANLHVRHSNDYSDYWQMLSNDYSDYWQMLSIADGDGIQTHETETENNMPPEIYHEK